MVLTSTVNVGVGKNVQIKDSGVRLQEYKSSLKKWITNQNVFNRIIFVENSGFDLSLLKKFINEFNSSKEVEFISFNSKEDRGRSGTGYGELEQIDRVIKCSKIIGDSFFKCTGRVFIKNIDNLRLNNYDIQCNFRNNLVYTNSVFFGCSVNIYNKYLQPEMLKNIENNKHFEQGLAMGIHSAILNGAMWSPIYPMPYIDGISGAKGYHYMKQFPMHRRFLKNITDYFCFKFSYTSYKDGKHYYDITK